VFIGRRLERHREHVLEQLRRCERGAVQQHGAPR
jgi:hypothetical protein